MQPTSQDVGKHQGRISKPRRGERKRCAPDGPQRHLNSRYCPAPTPATFSTDTFRKNSAAASGSTVLMNIPEPNSNPATRVSRGITLTYQWKYLTPAYSAGAVRMA